MKLGIYEKIIFTIIAACLVILTIQNLKPEIVTAYREEIIRIDLVKVGGNYISKREILSIGQEK